MSGQGGTPVKGQAASEARTGAGDDGRGMRPALWPLVREGPDGRRWRANASAVLVAHRAERVHDPVEVAVGQRE